jgi:hypothetical protein
LYLQKRNFILFLLSKIIFNKTNIFKLSFKSKNKAEKNKKNISILKKKKKLYILDNLIELIFMLYGGIFYLI